jgi:RHS repeat-associated protein
VVQTAGNSPNVYYLWSSVLGQPVVEMTAAGGVYRAYVYNPGGQMLAMQSYNGVFYWAHQDHLGSGHFLTTLGGGVAYRGEYDPHGQMVLETAPVGSYINSKKFTGYERNWATGLDYAMARNFQRTRGRFTTPDPLGVDAADASNPQSLNRYVYVENDPVNATDPTGLYMVCFYSIETWSGWIGNTYYINVERLVSEGCFDFGPIGGGVGPQGGGGTGGGSNGGNSGGNTQGNGNNPPDNAGHGGGPYHPPVGVKTKCKASDSCEQIKGKMWVLNRMINSHTGWDINVAPPNGGGRHSIEIADLWGAWSNCQALYQRKCGQNAPPFVPIPAPLPQRVPNTIPRVPVPVRTPTFPIIINPRLFCEFGSFPWCGPRQIDG